MESLLRRFLMLDGKNAEIDSDNNFIYTLMVKAEDVSTIKELYDRNFIEGIKTNDGKTVNSNNLSNFICQSLSIEFVTSDLAKIGYYLNFKTFIANNRFEIPTEFYIYELNYQSSSNDSNENIDKYNAVTALINILITKAKFISEGQNKTLCLVVDNSFIEIPIENIDYEKYLEYKNIELIMQYIEDVDSYKEKKTIFLKELIDFLTNKIKANRLTELILYFSEFYERCNTSFECYLSNFSFNKVKLELDNLVLEYSKNIRSIINESQSKLVAIPAAFVLGVYQINYSEPASFKNILITASAFLFSYIISIFIKNQQNALVIIADNLNNYKANYKRSKSTQFEKEKDLKNLSELINESHESIEVELTQQQQRLNILQKCNWGISIALLLSILIVVVVNNSTNIIKLWLQLILDCHYRC